MLPEIILPNRPKGLRFEIAALADPHFAIKAEAATIEIFDAIGPAVTAARITGALRAIGSKPVTVQINSPGGDPFVGAAIYNLLRAHSHAVTVQVLGMAASAASLIAMAGERILIARNGQMMIHRAKGGAAGDADFLASAAELLRKTDAGMATVYAARSKLPLDQVVGMMADETFMTADEAISLGFADALLDRDAAPAPQALASSAPRSKAELEQTLRSVGFSKSEAERTAAGGWTGYAREETTVDLSPVAAALRSNINEISNWR